MAFETTSELASFVEKELGHDLSGQSSQRSDIVSHLDQSHKVVLAGGGILNVDVRGNRVRENVLFHFAKNTSPKILTLRPAVTDKLITVNRSSTSATLNAAPDGSNSIAGWFIRVQGEPEVYQASAHTAASTSVTLDGGYVGPANASSATSALFPLQYTVGSGDVLRLVGPFRSYNTQNEEQIISLVDKDEMLDQCPLDQVNVGFPKLGAVLKESSGTFTVQFSSYPDDLERIEIDYIDVPDTLDTSSVNPIIPAQYRLVLAHLALYYMSLRNDDTRADKHLQIARDRFAELVDWNDQQLSSTDPDYGRVVLSGFTNTKRIRVQRSYIISS